MTAKYDTYKDSGIEWIGQIPSHWEIRALRAFLTPVSIKNRPEEQMLSVTRELGVIVRNVGDNDENHNVIPEDLSGYKFVEPGQFVINKMKSWQGSYGVSNHQGIVSPAYYVYNLACGCKDFFSKAIRSKAYIPFFLQYSKGIRVNQWDLSSIALKSIPFFEPPLAEQETIAAYLDRECVEYDRAVAQQQKMIYLLTERKRIIIFHAVTRGLNPDVPMRPSGIDQLGDIPAHWSVIRVKNITQMQSGDNLTSEQIKDEGDYPVYGGNGIRGFYHCFNTDGDVILVGRQGALAGNIHHVSGKFWATDHAVVSIVSKKHSVSFISYLFDNMNFNQYAFDTSAQPGLAVAKILNLSTAVPPIAEQEAIAAYLDEQCAVIDKAIEQKKRLIGLIQERKQIMINNVVTGKIKVS